MSFLWFLTSINLYIVSFITILQNCSASLVIVYKVMKLTICRAAEKFKISAIKILESTLENFVVVC